MSTKLAQRIAEQRKKRKLSQTQFAEKFGIGRSTIAMWETGDRIPDTETLTKLASFFGCSTDYLLGITDDPNPQSTDAEKPIDLKEVLEKRKKAHWGGIELNEKQRKIFKEYFESILEMSERLKEMEELLKKMGDAKKNLPGRTNYNIV